MALDDPVALHSTRPTVEIGGMSYPALDANIAYVRMTEQQGGLSTLELSVTDWVMRDDGSAGFGSDSGSPLVLGAGLRVFMGPAAVAAGEIFDGQIMAIEGEYSRGTPPVLTVIAEDRLFAARRKRQSRICEQRSPADLARLVAEDHGLTAEVRDGLDTPVADWVQQDESDLAFLRRILSRFDADVQIVGAAMQVGKLGIDQRSAITLDTTQTLEKLRVVADVANQTTEVVLASFDPAKGNSITGTADVRGCGPGAGQTGAQILSEKFAAIAVPLGRFGPMTQDEADMLAQAEHDKRARQFVQAFGTTTGNAQIRIGSWVTLSGVNPLFANVYSVTSATHRYERSQGYQTDFIAECAYLAEAA